MDKIIFQWQTQNLHNESIILLDESNIKQLQLKRCEKLKIRLIIVAQFMAQ